jgi:hypothetical protein
MKRRTSLAVSPYVLSVEIAFSSRSANYSKHVTLGPDAFSRTICGERAHDSIVHVGSEGQGWMSQPHSFWSYLAGTSTGAPLSFTKNTTNFAGLVWLALRPTTWTSSGPS